MNDPSRYDYYFDPNGDSTAAWVIRLVGRDKRVLELGTAGGSMTKVLQEHAGCKVTGVELDPELARRAQPHTERMIVADLDRIDLPQTLAGDRFDVIVAADVLEHLRDPWGCLRQLPALLEDRGHLVLSLPNVAHATVIAALLHGRFPYSEKGLLDRTHLRFFAREDLAPTLIDSGFYPAQIHGVRQAPDHTELASHWHDLDEATRRVLGQGRDTDVYQYVVKAIPLTEQAWKGHLRDRLSHLETEVGHWRALQQDTETRRRQTETELARLRQTCEDQARQVDELSRALAEAREACSPLSGRRPGQRLRRSLSRLLRR